MLKVLFAGSGEFGLPALRALRAAGHEVRLVISQPDRPAGRGHRLTPTPVSAFATAEGLPLLRTADVNAEALPEADLLVVIAFGQKLAPRVATHARLGAINLHASLLPKYRGAAPIHWAILRGETVTGNSVIRLAPRMDAGAVLAQSRLTIGRTETAGELHDRLAADGAPLVLSVAEALAAGLAAEVEQDESRATLAPRLTRASARLDLTLGADALARQVRGLFPWPGCRARVADGSGHELGRLTLARARVAEGVAAAAPPGTILADGSVAAADGRAVEVLELQPEGKRAMPLSAYRHGHPWPAGARLEPL